jgi:hypothetical protein
MSRIDQQQPMCSRLASPAVGNSAALLSAIAANDYANRRKQTKP